MKGSSGEPIIIGPSIEKPRWYQFWRWHLIARYKRECREAHEKLLEHFGQPVKGSYLGIAAYQMWNSPHDNAGNPCLLFTKKVEGDK